MNRSWNSNAEKMVVELIIIIVIIILIVILVVIIVVVIVIATVMLVVVIAQEGILSRNHLSRNSHAKRYVFVCFL
jgi:uncharacterized membrane protein YhaH (DUF805 family)